MTTIKIWRWLMPDYFYGREVDDKLRYRDADGDVRDACLVRRGILRHTIEVFMPEDTRFITIKPTLPDLDDRGFKVRKSK